MEAEATKTPEIKPFDIINEERQKEKHAANQFFSSLLRVWDRSHQLTLQIYAVTTNFPKHELYGLTSQIRRCSASIGANIAEGCGKRGNKEFQRYLQIASGSASELDYHLLLSRDLGILPNADYRGLAIQLTEVRKMLTSLLQKIETECLMAKC